MGAGSRQRRRRQTHRPTRRTSRDPARPPRSRGDTPHDESDPNFAPIEGVGLERYAELAVGMQGMDEEKFDAYAEANGVKPGAWPAVRDGWNARFESVPAVTMRWGQLYRQKLATAGVERPDITFEQHAAIRRHLQGRAGEDRRDARLTGARHNS